MSSFALTAASVFIPIALQLFFLRTVSYAVDGNIYGSFVLLQTVVLGVSSAFMQIPLTAQSRYHNSKRFKAFILDKFHGNAFIGGFLSVLSFICIIYYIPSLSFGYIYLLGSIYIVICNIIAVDQQYLLLELRRKDFLLTKISDSISRFMLPLIFYYIYEDLFGMVFGLTFGSVITYLVGAYYTKTSFLNPRFDYSLIKKCLKYAWPTAAVAIASWCILYLNRFYINNYLGSDDLANYALLFQLSSFLSVAGQVYGNHVNPIVLKKYSIKKIDAIVELRNSIKYFSLFLFFSYIASYFIPDSVYHLVISPSLWDSLDNRIVFYVLLLSTIFSLLQNASSMYFVISGKLHHTILFYLAGLLCCLLGNQFIHSYGLLAASITVLLSNVILFLLHFLYGRRVLTLSL